ncbi:MAG TPA: hypothetical protein VG713_00570 [Pirellulales bacterium]|nr:hypothetical protein [Pirellulales bacterium]
MMANTVMRILLGVVILIVSVAAGYRWWEERQANALVDDGNAAIEAGNDFAAKAGKAFEELFSESNLEGFPGNRDALRDRVNELAGELAKSAEQFRLAVTKFEEAESHNTDEKIKEYWGLKASAVTKLAESKEAYRNAVLTYLDAGLTDREALIAKINAAMDAASKLGKEYDDMNEQADKVQKENASKFKSS